MHQPHRHRAIVRPRLFDAQIPEVLGKIRRARWRQQLGDRDLEGVGQFFQIIHADMTFTGALQGSSSVARGQEPGATELIPRAQG